MNNGKKNLRQENRHSLRAARRLLSAVPKTSWTAEGGNRDKGVRVSGGDLCRRQKHRPSRQARQRHLRYIEQHHKIRYTNLLTSCKLTAYIADINEQAENMFFRLVKQLAEKEGVTEQLKADNQMLWVAKMNNIRNRATEIVNTELIYTW